MGRDSHIEWTDHTWNPWRGCTKVSAGCKHCYMFREQKRFGRDPAVVTRAADATIGFPLSAKVAAGDRVFTCSWSDWFHKAADDWRARAYDIIRQRLDVSFQILTKRPENIADRLPGDWGEGWPNVWLGVSVEDQATADARIPLLLQTPAAVRFVSYEPALGPVDFTQIRFTDEMGDSALIFPFAGQFICEGMNEPSAIKGGKIDWVICGGESGPKARRMYPDWARSARDQCAAAAVPFFFKQWGGSKPGGVALLDGVEHRAFPELRAM